MKKISRKTVKRAVRIGLGAAASPRRTKKQYEALQERRRIRKERAEDYLKWFEHYEQYANNSESQKEALKALKHKPLVSIVLPLYNTPEHFLRECIESVQAQSYENWELCITDDASKNNTTEVVKEYAKDDNRIKWNRNQTNQHITGASNKALELATGEFIALLDHDDQLMPNALFEVVRAMNQNPKADFFYSDEDKLEKDGSHSEPFFKPDWSPDFLRACNYITHFAVLRKSIVDEIGGFRLGTEGAQDWDIFLRFVRRSDKVVHIPKILYSWRKSETSTAKNADSKPYAYINQKRVLRDDIKETKLGASVFDHPFSGFWRIKYHIQKHPLVSIIIPTKDNVKLLKTCLESIIEKSTYPFFEIVVVDTGSKESSTHEFYKSRFVTANPIKVISWNQRFNFSSVCNYGARESNGDYFLFLNNDTEVITSDWIEGLLEHAQRQEVGVVGCKLLFPNDTIQHAGIVLREKDLAVHPFYGVNPDQDLFLNIYHNSIRNVSAVTAACTMISKEKFNEVGGFDEGFRVTYNDVDLCLRMRQKGYRVLYTPFVKLYHFESMSVGRISTKTRDRDELVEASKKFVERWGEAIKHDPFYNENFIPTGNTYRVDPSTYLEQ